MRVAVLGASGLVGSVLVKRLLGQSGMEVRACVRSPSTSWSLIPLGIDLVPADLRDQAAVRRAIDGCTHVVNCALGEDKDLVVCMERLVSACRDARIRRLVHLSSVTVYGDPPGPDCARETGIPRPRRGTYGWYKMRQDEVALKASRAGLSTAVLCLPHVTGPNSRFLLSLLRELREGRFAFVDGGIHPVVLADVVNVSQGIELALRAERVDGTRMFINDGTPPSWGDLVRRISRLAPLRLDSVPNFVERDVVVRRTRTVSLRNAAVQILALPEVKSILRGTIAGQDGFFVRRVRQLAKRAGAKGVVGPGRAARDGGVGVPPDGLWRQQLRKVPHSIESARKAIAFEPAVTFDASMAAFERWFASVHHFGTGNWELARRI